MTLKSETVLVIEMHWHVTDRMMNWPGDRAKYLTVKERKKFANGGTLLHDTAPLTLSCLSSMSSFQNWHRTHIVLHNRWKLLSHVNSQSLIGNNKKVTLLSLGGNCKGVVMSWFAKDKHLWQIELTCLNCRPIISRSGHSSQWRWLL